MTEESKTHPVDDPKPGPVDNLKNQDDDVVKYASYKKLLDEKKSISSKHSENLAKLSEYEARDKALEEQKLLDEKKFSEAYAKKDEELQSALLKASALEKDQLDIKKIHSFLGGLGDAKLEQKYFSLIPLDSIKTDETGALDQESLLSTVNNFKAEHQRLLVTSKNDLPHNKVGSTGGKGLTVSEWKNLGTAKEMRARFSEVDFSTKP